jgi:hypothetical protein
MRKTTMSPCSRSRRFTWTARLEIGSYVRIRSPASGRASTMAFAVPVRCISSPFYFRQERLAAVIEGAEPDAWYPRPELLDGVGRTARLVQARNRRPMTGALLARSADARALSAEVDTGSVQESASKRRLGAVPRRNAIGRGSNPLIENA